MVQTENRNRTIIKTSLIGIAANVFLASFKAAVGLISSSVSVILDAVNNLSDALSSLITIIGTKLAHRSPDRKHPLGHGRAEYLSATVIAIIVLYAGVTSLVESIKKIIHPQTPSYTVWALMIITAAIAVKLLLGRFVKSTGERVDSDALKASGSDALFDAVISLGTLITAGIFMLTHVSLEAYVAGLISLYIIKSGIEMLMETLSEIIGKRVDPELARKVKACINSFEQVGGAYDLIIHNYGPEQLIASVHIELPENMSVGEADALERAISEKVYSECGVIITGISVYSQNTLGGESHELEQKVRSVVSAYPQILGMHGFFLSADGKDARFDVIVSFEEKDRESLHKRLLEQVKAIKPDCTFNIVLDYDISD